MAWEKVASGLFASCPQDVEAPLRVVDGLEDIVALMKDKDAEQCIAVTTVAGGSAVSTIIKRTKAVVTTIGGPQSHIVVVSRDYGVPCVVAAGDLDVGALTNGTAMRLTESGEVHLEVNGDGN
jgi:phosphoenolpyruvate-protein kinase (PTS system EI component)